MKMTEAELFKALGVDSRLKIINLLKEKGPLGVNELAEALGVTPSAVSQHLKVLRFAGLVHCQRKGYCLPYDVDAEALEECKQVLSDVCTCGCRGSGRGKKRGLRKKEEDVAQLREYERHLKDELEKVQARIEAIKTTARRR
jgi:DNA-binding transcriptional ArsR family regulator